MIADEDLQFSGCAVYRRMLDEQPVPQYSRSVAFEHREFPPAKYGWGKPAPLAARYFSGLHAELGIKFRTYCFSQLSYIGFSAEELGSAIHAAVAANGTSRE